MSNTSINTHTYKIVEGHEIKLDVIHSQSTNQSPALIWIHGGALIAGARQMLCSKQRDLYIDAGFTIISIDYRLAPETKLPFIVEDVQDAIHWVRKNGTKLNIKENYLAIVGHSAGGYLALLSGVLVKPTPDVIVSFYGYGDIAADFYTKPDLYYLSQPHVSNHKARSVVGTRTISNDSSTHRAPFYQYCRQHGLWPQEVVGTSPETDSRIFKSYSPLFHINPNFPPVMLLHGDSDTDVPFEQSLMFSHSLRKANVRHKLIKVPNGKHCFDSTMDDSTRNAILQVIHLLENSRKNLDLQLTV